MICKQTRAVTCKTAHLQKIDTQTLATFKGFLGSSRDRNLHIASRENTLSYFYFVKKVEKGFIEGKTAVWHFLGLLLVIHFPVYGIGVD